MIDPYTQECLNDCEKFLRASAEAESFEEIVRGIRSSIYSLLQAANHVVVT